MMAIEDRFVVRSRTTAWMFWTTVGAWGPLDEAALFFSARAAENVVGDGFEVLTLREALVEAQRRQPVAPVEMSASAEARLRALEARVEQILSENASLVRAIAQLEGRVLDGRRMPVEGPAWGRAG